LWSTSVSSGVSVSAFVSSFDVGGWTRGPVGSAELDPACLVEGGIEDDKGCLVPA
jgi:hypothetical protein